MFPGSGRSTENCSLIKDTEFHEINENDDKDCLDYKQDSKLLVKEHSQS